MASRDLKPSLERNQLSSVLDAVLEVQLVQRRTTEAVTKVNLRGLRVRFATLKATDAAEIAEAAVKDVAACLN